MFLRKCNECVKVHYYESEFETQKESNLTIPQNLQHGDIMNNDSLGRGEMLCFVIGNDNNKVLMKNNRGCEYVVVTKAITAKIENPIAFYFKYISDGAFILAFDFDSTVHSCETVLEFLKNYNFPDDIKIFVDSVDIKDSQCTLCNMYPYIDNTYCTCPKCIKTCTNIKSKNNFALEI